MRIRPTPTPSHLLQPFNSQGHDQKSDNQIVEQASDGKVLMDWGPQEVQNWLVFQATGG